MSTEDIAARFDKSIGRVARPGIERRNNHYQIHIPRCTVTDAHKKILYLSKTTVLGDRGGAEERLDSVSKRLSEEKDITIICGATEAGLPKKVRKDGRTVKHIKLLPNVLFRFSRFSFYLSRYLFPVILMFYLPVELKRKDYDMVVEYMTPYPSLAGLVANIFSVPIVAVQHGFFDKSYYGDYGYFVVSIQLFLQRFLLVFNYELIIVPSNHTLEKMTSFGINKGDIVVVENGVSICEFPRRVKNDISYDVLCLSRVTKSKNHETLIRSIKMANKISDHTIQLHIAGNGPYLDKIKSYATKIGIGQNITFYGDVRGRDKSKLFDKCDVFAYSSEKESFGIVLMEAMASGMPIVAKEHPAYRSFFSDRRNGYLLNPGTYTQFAYSIIEILNSEKYEDISKANIKDSSNYNWDMISDRTEKCLDAHLDKP